MSYSPSDYLHLFPKGLFDAPDVITKWGESHRLFALNQEPFSENEKKLAGGLVLKRGHIKFNPAGFSNYQIFEIEPKKRNLRILFTNHGEYPINAFSKISNLYFLATLGYFYLTTDKKRDEMPAPKIKTNNFFVHGGQFYHLPVVDRSALLIFKNGQVSIPFLRARGTFKIGQNEFSWIGRRDLNDTQLENLPENQAVVYTSSVAKIVQLEDPIIGPFRKAQKTLTDELLGRFNAIIERKQQKHFVAKISQKPLPVTKGAMILNLPGKFKSQISVGDALNNVTIDNLKVSDIYDAVSVGPKLEKDKKARIAQARLEGHDYDPSLSNTPHDENCKMARSCLVLRKDNTLASVLVDGIPQARDIYPGVTPQELSGFVFDFYPDVREVVATDPGGTMKSVHRTKYGEDPEVFGNSHYLDYKYFPDGAIKFWPNGRNGRKAVTFLGVF